ncbi:MAG: DNRLRE domain-containing protein [Pseudomonadales bacterium]|nr:DNRLRE domain-containing protein [Pseudomonadales bacterium]
MNTIVRAFISIALLVSIPSIALSATQFNRLVWDADPAHQATIGFSPLVISINPYVKYGFDTNEDNWSRVWVTDTQHFQVGLMSHFVRLSGLPANSPVYYRVCDLMGCGQRLWFKTAPEDNSPFVVVAGGDTRTGLWNRRAGNRLISKIRPLFIMHGGDYTNLNTFVEMGVYLADWELTFSDDVINGESYKRIYPFVPTHGNHEDSDYSTLCKVFGVDYNQDGNCDNSDTFGAFNVSPLLRVYTLNSQYKNSGYASYATAMNEWLYSDLATHGGSAAWRMAQYHKPMFPHYTGKSDNKELFDWWADAFYRHSMNVVVESDTHINKLTRAIRPDGDDFVAVDDGGTVYVGEGSWGAPSRSANKPKDWTIDLASIQQFKVIQVAEDELTVRTAQFDNSASSLSREAREADALALPEGVNWWLANEVGDKVILSRTAEQLSLIENGGGAGDGLFVSLALTDDAFVAKNESDRNFDGSSEGLLVDGLDINYGQVFSLMKFDLMNMPSCIDSDSAKLALNITNTSLGSFDIFTANRRWQEENITWDSASGIVGDYVASFTPNSDGMMEIDLGSTGIIQDWLLQGNYGLVIRDHHALDGLDFTSKESGNGAVLKLAFDEQETCEGSDTVEVANQALEKQNFKGEGVKEVVLAITMTSDNDNARLEELAITAGGDFDETQLMAVELYIDENKDGVADPAELSASGTYATDNGELVFVLDSPYYLPEGDTSLLVTYQF